MDNQTKEHKDQVNHTNTFFAGLLMGAMAGAGVMLLLAPQSGAKTRAQLQQKGIELRDQAVKGVESAEEAVTQVRVTAQRMTADVRHKAEELQKQGQDLIGEQKERLSTLIEAG
jgi:gas vesicle protein